MSGEAEDFDLLAGIYVLGALEPAEARVVEDLADRQPEIAQAIEAWQNRLAPLASAIPPVTPPASLWGRIAATIGVDEATAPLPAATPKTAQVIPFVKAWRSVALWRTATAAFALAAAYAGFVVLSRPEPVPVVTALAPMGSPAPAFLAQLQSDGSLLVRPLSDVRVAAGKDLELWSLPEGAKAPISLGVLPTIGRTIPARQVPQGPGQLLVSLEPTGGSPTGQPTGPVLYGGALKRL